MKLGDFWSKPLSEALEELDMVDIRVYTDDSGYVRSVEIKYEYIKEKSSEKSNMRRF